MKIIKVNNVNVVLDFSNQFVIARVQRKHANSEEFLLNTSEIVTTIARKCFINGLDIELIAIDEDNNCVVFTSNIDHHNHLLNCFNEAYASCYFLFYADIEPDEIIEKMKEICKQSIDDKCFREVIVEPSSGSEISDVVKEMKSLSEIIGMPVCAKFNGKNLRITSTTDITHTINCFWKGIKTDSIS